MVYGKSRKSRKKMMTIISLGIFVSFFISTIKLHGYALTAEQAEQTIISKNIGSDNVSRNRTATITTISEFHPRVESKELFDLENIPAFMKNYFEWHGQQLQQIKKDAKKWENDGNGSKEKDAYLSNYRFLVLRCAAGKNNGGTSVVEDRCGGLSDRLKPFPLFLWYAATTNRILFIRWGKKRPAAIETFMVPGSSWNWTFPDVLLRKIEELEENNVSSNSNHNENFTRLYFDGSTNQQKQMLNKIGDQDVWMIEGNDFTGGSLRYETYVNAAIKTASQSTSVHSDAFSASELRPGDTLYENFYHDLFHASFRPSSGVDKLLGAYFRDQKNEFSSASRSWLPVPLQRNQYAVAHYRAKYPREPYRETWNRTILRETTIHAVECAKSRVSKSKVRNDPQNMSSTATLAKRVSAVYVASDTALAVEAVRDTYHNNHDANASEEGADPMNSINVWTYLDLQTYDTDTESGGRDGDTVKTKHAITLAEDPPHLNFAERDDISAFYVIFVDLFLMSYASCVVYGAGGFGRLGSLVSYRPWCGMPYTVNNGNLQHCNPYDW